MGDEVESHTIRLLQEMRESMRRIEGRLDGMDRGFEKVDERFDDLTLRVDGNTLILNMLAGLVAHHEERIEALEGRS